ncbi:venom protease-like [Planococcus citri]|uniref:venom protease-like n=1 Tax=Planococcus citri TaxID=170843 RepID=UPI0031F7AE34
MSFCFSIFILSLIYSCGHVLSFPDDAHRNMYSSCGKSTKIVAKIIGGKITTPGDWPWMVAIGFRYPSKPTRPRFACGGSLISDTWILTAGHCVRSVGKSTQTVARVGEIDLTKDSATDMLVEEIILHPRYTYSSPFLNDIALLKLKNPVIFTTKIRPICLPKLNEHKDDKFYANKPASIAGWGDTRSGECKMTNILLEAQVDMVDRKTCAQNYTRYPYTIDQRVLCASRLGQDTCQGDSGGPLMMPIENSYYLIGITSCGNGCAKIGYPGVYTKVGYFSDWIRLTTGIET